MIFEYLFIAAAAYFGAYLLTRAVFRKLRRGKQPPAAVRCATCDAVIEGRSVAYPTTPVTWYCSQECADSLPWCEACGSYHHPTNTSCFKLTGQRRSR